MKQEDIKALRSGAKRVLEEKGDVGDDVLSLSIAGVMDAVATIGDDINKLSIRYTEART